jgi:hypothetical protein
MSAIIIVGRSQLVGSKAERCRSGRSSTLGKRSGRAIRSLSEAPQRTRDQRVSNQERLLSVRPQTSMFFEVLMPTYHIPITIDSPT